MEIIKKIPFAKNYYASNLGYIKNNKNQILKPRINDRGYESVVLYIHSKPKSFRIGRLILSVFTNVNYITYPFEANHKDENKLNNNINNLNWLSRKENMNWNKLQSKIKRNSYISENAIKAVKEKLSKPIVATNNINGSKLFFKSIADAKRMGYNAGNISACCLGKRKQHAGYKWSFR